MIVCPRRKSPAKTNFPNQPENAAAKNRDPDNAGRARADTLTCRRSHRRTKNSVSGFTKEKTSRDLVGLLVAGVSVAHQKLYRAACGISCAHWRNPLWTIILNDKFGDWNLPSHRSHHPCMKIATVIARVLLGLIFVIFGSNAFLHFLPMPPLPQGLAGDFLQSVF